MKSFGYATIAAFFVGVATAQNAAERVWTGVNGKTFRGSFHQLTADRQKVEFRSTEGKMLTVALDNLIPADRDWILNPIKPPADTGSAGDVGKFKPAASPSRQLTPSLDPKTFGCSTNQSLVDALWISLLWWDQTGVLEVPERGDLESKAEWLHKKLTRAVVKGGDNVSAEDAKKGVEQYFSEELEKVAACRVTLEQKDFSAGRLGGLLQGPQAVVMRMSMQYSNGGDFAVSSVLESMTEDGKFVIHVFGRRFSGVLKPVEGAKAGRDREVPFEYVLDRPKDLPDYYAQNEARFFMGRESWNAVVILKPYVYLEPGKPIPLPEEDKPPVVAKPATPVEMLEPKVKFPVGFLAPVVARREWSLTDGSKILAIPEAPNGQQVSLRSVSGEAVSVDAASLSEEDRARLCFWEACHGTPLSMPKLDLSYRLNTPAHGSFQVNVSADGSSGRVTFTAPESTMVLVYDMTDGAFVSTHIRRINTKETTWIHQGRFLPEYLLPRKIFSGLKQENVDLFLSGILPRAPELISAVVPCRRVRFPELNAPTFHKPDIDFVLCEQTTVTAGLYQLLFSGTAGAMKDGTYVFAPIQVPSNRDGKSVLATLAACRVLPLRIAWENPLDPNQNVKFYRARDSGKFSLELTRAAIPDGFPVGHFAIPAEARAMPAGDMQTTKSPNGP